MPNNSSSYVFDVGIGPTVSLDSNSSLRSVTVNSVNIAGGLNVEDGESLSVGSATTPGAVNNAGYVAIGDSSTLDLLGGGTYSQTGRGVTGVNGTLISPTVSVTGGILEGSGKIQGDVTVANGFSRLQPGGALGSPGALLITGDVTLGDTQLAVDIAGGTVCVPGAPCDPSDGYSVLDVTGTLTLVNSEPFLYPISFSGFNLAHGETLDVVNAGSISGVFSDDSIIPVGGGAFIVEASSTGCAFGSDCIKLVYRAQEPSAMLLSAVDLLVFGVLCLRCRKRAQKT